MLEVSAFLLFFSFAAARTHNPHCSMGFCPKFTSLFSVEAPCNKFLETIYTNDEYPMAYHIGEFERLLKWEEDAIVGIDVEYTSPEDGDKHRAAVVLLCIGKKVLLYHISEAEKRCFKFDNFLKNSRYTFAGFSIGRDIEMLEKSGLFVHNFVDIQGKWRVPEAWKELDSLADVAELIIDEDYGTMKDGFSFDDHCQWAFYPLSLKHINYAAIDAFASYDIWRRMTVFKSGFKRLKEDRENKFCRRFF